MSRHVVFDESSFPFANMSTSPVDPNTLTFLSDDDAVTVPIGPRVASVGPSTAAGEASDAAAPADTLSQAAASSAHGAHGASSSAAAPADSPSRAVASSAPDGSGAAAPGDPTSQAAAPLGTAAPASQVVASGTRRTVSTTPLAITPVANAHSMHTRGKSGFIQPVDRLNLSAAALSPLPGSVRSALVDPNWRAAMQSEFDALKANDTWSLVPRPPGVNIVTGKWVFRHKFLADGTLDRYKARWVLRGFTQRPGS